MEKLLAVFSANEGLETLRGLDEIVKGEDKKKIFTYIGIDRNQWAEHNDIPYFCSELHENHDYYGISQGRVAVREEKWGNFFEILCIARTKDMLYIKWELDSFPI